MPKVGLIGWCAGLALMCAAVPAGAQTPAPPDATTNDGIPVQSDLVRAKCGSCHRSDDKGRMSRISYRRATPENWERTIKRMVTLNHATLEPADARNILKYLADHQGLAPEEDRPITFDAERRTIEYTYVGGQGRVGHLLVVPLDGARARRAADEGRMGAARRDAPRLLPARGQPADERRSGIPAHAADADRAGTGRPSAGQPASDGQGARAHREDAAADDAGVVGVVRRDAGAKARRALGDRRIAGGQRTDLRSGDGDVRPGRAGQLHHRDAVHRRAQRRDAHAHRKGARLHRLPVARPRLVGRQRPAVARGDVRRARLDADVGTLVHRRATTRPAST